MSIVNHGNLELDAESLYKDFCTGVKPLIKSETHVVGVISGGLWLARRMAQDLGLNSQVGAISSGLHRDDFSRRGLSDGGQTKLPFEIDGAHILLIDDVLYTGRTIRAVLNELFDFGRPASVQLDYAAVRLPFADSSKLTLEQDAQGLFKFLLESKSAK